MQSLKNKTRLFSQLPLNMLTVIISFLLALTMFFFIERKSVDPSIILFENNLVFYALMFAFAAVLCTLIIIKQKNNFKKATFFKELAIALIPAELSLIAGLFVFNYETHANIAFYLFIFLFPAAVLFFIIFYRNDFHETKETSAKLWLKRQGTFFIFALLLVVSTNIYFSTKNIGNFAAVDEPLWTFDRIPGYWKNISEGDFNNTAISDKPGITVALLSGIGLLQVDPSNYESRGAQPLANDITVMNKAFRLPIAIFCALSLFFFYFLLEKLLGKKIALLSTSLIALSPPIVGMSRIINPDALLWVFAPLTLLSYFVFLKNRTRAMLFAIGTMLGLSLLTKYVSNILIIFILVAIFIEAILTCEKLSTREKYKKYFSQMLADFGSILAIALSIFYVLFPAAWQKPSKLFYATLGSQAFAPVATAFLLILTVILADTFIFKNAFLRPIVVFLNKKKIYFIRSLSLIFTISTAFVFVDVYLGMKPFDFQEILSSPKTSSLSIASLGIFTANFYPLIFTVIPVTILGILYATTNIFRNFKLLAEEKLVSLYLITFVLLYYLATTVSGVSATIRYQIVLFPLLGILAGIGISQISDKISKKYSYTAMLSIVFFSGIWALTSTAPHYLGYVSSLLPKKYFVDVKDMGDGSYEAAQFLNSLPGADKLFVWTDKKGVCNFFVGECDSFSASEEFRANKIDYFIISSGRKSRSSNIFRSRISNPYDFNEIYNSEDYLHEIIINQRPGNYVRVLEAQKFLKK